MESSLDFHPNIWLFILEYLFVLFEKTVGEEKSYQAYRQQEKVGFFLSPGLDD